MFFKNAIIYRMTASWVLSAAVVNNALAAFPSEPISGTQQIGHGWATIYDDQFVHVVNRQYLLQLNTEKKVVPPSALRAAVDKEVERVTSLTGRKPGKKEKREIKDNALMYLLPSALATTVQTRVWIDPVNGWIVVNAGSPARADIVIKELIRALEKLELQTLHITRDPGTVMTEWLSNTDTPTDFTIDQACELKALDETKAVVKYGNSNLNADDLRDHIRQGKRCVNLALTWQDKISFVLTDKFRIKKMSFLDALLVEHAAQKPADERESHDNDFVLMTGELNSMLNSLVAAFGGEKPRDDSELF